VLNIDCKRKPIISIDFIEKITKETRIIFLNWFFYKMKNVFAKIYMITKNRIISLHCVIYCC